MIPILCKSTLKKRDSFAVVDLVFFKHFNRIGYGQLVKLSQHILLLDAYSVVIASTNSFCLIISLVIKVCIKVSIFDQQLKPTQLRLRYRFCMWQSIISVTNIWMVQNEIIVLSVLYFGLHLFVEVIQNFVADILRMEYFSIVIWHYLDPV